ncbi:hypothetical protein I350_01011 [Cryptococcus amylolentus CBS 6273]|uniref:BZIP domain-containing protein n=1 Tax=Cryptococcus amylolentus CBS 6273 TaxID=1296118 RepID=A0A1E3KBR4_9TREE|nr:hypothetical protein I350_01011 [Cryptococcus amylolentus CBS 6273]
MSEMDEDSRTRLRDYNRDRTREHRERKRQKKLEEEKASKDKEKSTTSTAQPDDNYDSRFPVDGEIPDFDDESNLPPLSQAEMDAMSANFGELWWESTQQQ